MQEAGDELPFTPMVYRVLSTQFVKRRDLISSFFQRVKSMTLASASAQFWLQSDGRRHLNGNVCVDMISW